MKIIATSYSLLNALQRLTARVMALEARPTGSSSSGAAAIYAGAADPNGTQSATGPSLYLRTNTSPPTVYFKTSAGTSNNEWQ